MSKNLTTKQAKAGVKKAQKMADYDFAEKFYVKYYDLEKGQLGQYNKLQIMMLVAFGKAITKRNKKVKQIIGE